MPEDAAPQPEDPRALVGAVPRLASLGRIARSDPLSTSGSYTLARMLNAVRSWRAPKSASEERGRG